MLKKLLVSSAMLLVVALLAVPALANPADLSLEWGSEQWLINEFGVNGDITPFCQSIKPDAQASFAQQYPNLPSLCGWSQGSSSQPPAAPAQGSGSSQPAASPTSTTSSQ
jgi:hypothetical protein